MFKGLANLGALLKQAQQIGGQMGQITEEMRKMRVTGVAGGGMVEIEVNGLMEVLRCRIDPQLIAQSDRELLEDLVVAAINQAIAKSKQTHADKVRELTGGLPLPGAFHEALAKFSGTEGEGSEERGEGSGDRHSDV
jgi:nucleoid-associated protein EbfC